MPLSLKTPLVDNFDYTVVERYLEAMVPGRVKFDPVTSQFEEECRTSGLNWLILWSLGCALTNYYVYGPLTEARNYFGVPGGASYRLWREGIREGIKWILGHGVVSVEDLDRIYGKDVSSKTIEIYNGVLSFTGKEGSKPPPPVSVEPPPLPPQPLPEEPAPKEPPPKPGSQTSWKVWLANILGIAGVIIFIAKFFLPGAAVEIITFIFELLKKIVAS